MKTSMFISIEDTFFFEASGYSWGILTLPMVDAQNTELSSIFL